MRPHRQTPHTHGGGRARAMGLGVGGPLLVAHAHLRHDGRSLTEQDGRARPAEDKIDPSSLGQHLEYLGGGQMTVPTDEEVGPRPVPPPHGEETHPDHGICSPRGARARAQSGGHQRV